MISYLHRLVSAFGLALLPCPVYAEELYGNVVPLVSNLSFSLEGEAHVIDGDTITIRQQRIRFHGIDALEHDQACSDEWSGGVDATDFLSKLVAGQIVTCLIQGWDEYQSAFAICSVGNTNLNEAMVLNGYALADTLYSQAYRRTEQVAKSLGSGFHKPGRHCVSPWSWRSASPIWGVADSPR